MNSRIASATNIDGSLSVRRMDIGPARQSGEIRKLTSLVEISQALSSAIHFKASLHRVLEILEKSHDAVRSAVALASDDRAQLQDAGSTLEYSFDSAQERTGIPAFLAELAAAGIAYRDLNTRQSSLEDIFVSLVRGRR